MTRLLLRHLSQTLLATWLLASAVFLLSRTGSEQAVRLAQPEARALVEAEVDRLNGELAPFERIKKFALLDRELSQDAGELTPTLKVRRRIVAERFAAVIDQLYGAR